MAIVVSFSNYTPPPRFDGTPWNRYRIEEATSPEGPWTVIDLVSLGPIDTDPRSPLSRSFSAENATLDQGWYRVSFLDANDNVVPFDPVQNITEAPYVFVPTLAQIGRVILSRTKGEFGALRGTFASDTTPNNIDASGCARDAARDMVPMIGEVIPVALIENAQRVCAIRAAMNIELSFYSDQVNTGRSVYPQLEKDLETQLCALQLAITLAVDGDGTVVNAAPSTEPEYYFPPPTTFDSQLY